MASARSKNFENISSSFWALPAVLVGASFALSLASVEIDRRFFAKSAHALWLFGGSPDAAREVLSVIAGSLITVVAVAFSVTIVALQQASTQYSPRVLNRFTQDRGNQLVLGVYIGTFTFSLIVLWSIRSEDGTGGQFVPALSVMIAGLMALASLGLLVYFIHHIIDLIRIPTILAGIRGQLDQQIRKICKNPQGKGDPKEERYIEAVQQTSSRRVGRETVVVSEFEGHIRMIDEDRLYSLFKDEKKAFVWIPRAVGEYLIPGSVLVRIWAAKEQNDHWTKQLRKIVVIDAKRSIYQDPIYGFRQLVDVALKALSPGLNDPTTAEQCLLYLKGALGLIVARELPRMSYQRDGVHYLLKKPSFNDFVGISFNQIVHAGKHDSHVMMSVLSTIDELIPLCPSSERMHALLSPVDTIITNAESPRVQEAARQIRANAVLRK